MRIAHCIDCGEYKYIENKGKCRSCISSTKLNIGINNNDKTNLIEPEILHSGLHITGDIGTGKTTMAIHILKQLQDMGYGICYFDMVDSISKSEFNFKNGKEIDFKSNDGFNIMNIERNSNYSNYLGEINKTTKIINKIILNNTDNIPKYTNQFILKQIIKSVLKLPNEYTLKYVYDCLIDVNKRNNLLDKSPHQVPRSKSKINIRRKTLDLDDTIVSSLHTIINDDEIMCRISKEGYILNINKIIKNSQILIIQGDINIGKFARKIINSILSEKIYSEIKLQDNPDNKFVFCYDFINEINNIKNILYSSGHKYNISTIDIKLSVNKNDIKKPDNVLIFQSSGSMDLHKLNSILSISKNKIKQLYPYEYILNTKNSKYKGKLNI